MSVDFARQQVRRVFTVYPSYRAYLESLSDGNETLDAWCEMLAACDKGDLGAVVDEIVEGTREPIGKFQKPDQFPFNLRTEANERRAKRQRKADQEQKYHQPVRSKAMDWVKNQKTGRIAVWLGEQVRSGNLSKSENDQRMVELLEWDKGGDKPAWMNNIGLDN